MSNVVGGYTLFYFDCMEILCRKLHAEIVLNQVSLSLVFPYINWMLLLI